MPNELIGGMTRQARVDAGRCVHARIETASCRACVEACPHGAWRLDEAGLRLSVADCDGCGLCVAACPTRAMAAPTGRAIARCLNGLTVLMAACERALPEGGEGCMTCLHALATSDLLRHWRGGERVWLVSTAECANCDRGRGEGLFARVEHINRMLAARGEPRLLVKTVPLARWRHLYELAVAPSGERRAFFQRLWRRPVATLLEGTGQDGQEAASEPPGVYLPGPGPLPWTVRIDPQACVVCQACIRVCPEEALRLRDDMAATPGRWTLSLEHSRCTGCGLCVDVCEHRAIAVQAWTEPEQAELLLRESVCRACGVPFKMTEVSTDTPHLCWVCARSRPARRLYQVLDAA